MAAVAAGTIATSLSAVALAEPPTAVAALPCGLETHTTENRKTEYAWCSKNPRRVRVKVRCMRAVDGRLPYTKYGPWVWRYHDVSSATCRSGYIVGRVSGQVD
jgi:hypothetical protein